MIKPQRIWTTEDPSDILETVDGSIAAQDATSADVGLRVHNSSVIVESVLTLCQYGCSTVVQLVFFTGLHFLLFKEIIEALF